MSRTQSPEMHKSLVGKSLVGFEVGDIVLGVNGQPVDSVETLAALIDTLPHHHRITLFALDHTSGRAGNVKIEIR